ncbi:hypothetical protein BDZ91DRAFT_803272 [Kalaharituber pfeilii]|nr:hypothetical protein BDZ91DRAFT_803272 [Kalaharituber pfeilii]
MSSGPHRESAPRSPPQQQAKARLRQKTIDIYNSTSTGHQVGSGVSKPISWHKSRTTKLQQQFRSNPLQLSAIAASAAQSSASVPSVSASKEQHGDHQRHTTPAPAKLVTVQAATFEPRKQHTFRATAVLAAAPAPTPGSYAPSTAAAHSTLASPMPLPTTAAPQAAESSTKKIFFNCTIYINGTTSPSISDHLLKRHLCSHGASIATMLHRKSVTHVILGKPSSSGGAGGGLAAGKLHKELTKNGRPIKFVSVEWVLDSIKAGKRLSERNYPVLNMHSQSQRNMASFVKRVTITTKTSASPGTSISAAAASTGSCAGGANPGKVTLDSASTTELNFHNTNV